MDHRVEFLLNNLEIGHTKLEWKNPKANIFNHLFKHNTSCYRGWVSKEVEQSAEGELYTLFWTSERDSHQYHTRLKDCPKDAVMIQVTCGKVVMWSGCRRLHITKEDDFERNLQMLYDIVKQYKENTLSLR